MQKGGLLILDFNYYGKRYLPGQGFTTDAHFVVGQAATEIGIVGVTLGDDAEPFEIFSNSLIVTF